MNNWMIPLGSLEISSNYSALKPITIYDISYLVGQAYSCAFVQNNIVKSFKCTVFFPVNKNIFIEVDLLFVNVTDRPIVDTETSVFNDSIEVEGAPTYHQHHLFFQLK